nr:unnamed protein product [Trichobilharzia regenti]
MYREKLYPVQELLRENFDKWLLENLSSWIIQVVEVERTRRQQRFTIRSGVDPTLDRWNETYTCLPDLLSHMAEGQMTELRANIRTCGLIYFPMVGYLLKIPKVEVETPDIHISCLEFAFTETKIAYYRNDTTRTLDRRYGDVMYSIVDTETTIMRQLQRRLLIHAQSLLRASQFAAEIDCLCSLAIAAKSKDWKKPKLAENDLIRIRSGRHPIQKTRCKSIIKNLFYADASNHRITFLTGPNGSGKSTYMNQIALIIYLTQIGSYVPAEEAVISPLDAIYILTGTGSEKEDDYSAYISALHSVSVALRTPTKRTLLVMDEFASVIDKWELNALTTAMVEFLLNLGECPFAVIATHNYGILKHFQVSGPRVQYLTMKTTTHEGKLLCLYEVTNGITSESEAIAIAKNIGLPLGVIERALELRNSPGVMNVKFVQPRIKK